ncbi:MAG: hypothetical protein ACJAWO_000497 [Halieaceae bacterium]|jgi:hypothetical protein
MTKEKYIQDLSDIKNMMEKSSRFLSLSGKSGILAGIFALGGAWAGWKTLYGTESYFNRDLVEFVAISTVIKLGLIALLTLLLSIGFGIYLTRESAKKQGRPFWDNTSKNLLLSLCYPLMTGGLVSLILISKGLIGLVAPTTLIFYGLGLISASKYTVSDIHYLGIAEVVLGLAAAVFIGYGLFFWALGFGFLHIIYGTVMYFKYEKQ